MHTAYQPKHWFSINKVYNRALNALQQLGLQQIRKHVNNYSGSFHLSCAKVQVIVGGQEQEAQLPKLFVPFVIF